MLKLNVSTKFKRDYKVCNKRGYNLKVLQCVIDILRMPEILERKHKDHKLSGNYEGCRECHILPDWLLIYRITEDEIYLVRTGTHSDLFGI